LNVLVETANKIVLEEKNVHKILPTTAKLAAKKHPLVSTAAVSRNTWKQREGVLCR
jgi:hypothetical protein